MIGINHKIYLILIFLVSGIIIIWFLPGFIISGYMGYDLISGWINNSDHLLAPPQDVYRKDPQIMAALQFLSRRWNTPVHDLYVLATRKFDSWVAEVGGKKFGVVMLEVVDSSSLASAGLFILTSGDYPNDQQPIAHEGTIYLQYEFKPESPQQMSIARKFYTIPSPLKEGRFAVIGKLNVTPLGNGEIVGLGGNPRFPVIFGFVFKRGMVQVN